MPQKTILLVVLADLNSIMVVYMDPLGGALIMKVLGFRM